MRGFCQKMMAKGLDSSRSLGFSYPTDVFPRMSVAALLKKVKVSAIRAVPCKMKEKVIVGGVPGLLFFLGIFVALYLL